MKIRMLMNIGGMFHGIDGGVQRGDEVEVDDASGLRYIAAGYAEAVSKRDARKADKAADSFDREVAGNAEALGVEITDPPGADDERAADARALEPDAVIHDETPAYDPTEPPVALDEPVDDEMDPPTGEREHGEPDQRDEPRLVPQFENDKPVKNALAEPLDDPEFVDDAEAKGVITDPEEVDENYGDVEGVVAEPDPKKAADRRARGRNRRR